MAVTDAGHGTQTATLTTEHTLLDIALAGTYTLEVDTDAMVDGDITILRAYHILLTSGTRKVSSIVRLEGEQPPNELIVVSDPISNYLTDSGSVRFTLQQTVGTGRAYDWTVNKHA